MSCSRQSSPGALLQQGIQLDQAGQHDAAAKLYRQIIEQQPDHAYASHLLGADALRRGDFDVAIELIGAAIMASLCGVPSIAISAGLRFDEVGTEFPSTFEILDPAAEFACSVIDSLRSSRGENGRLLPENILLSINYPALPRHLIKGILHPEISSGHLIEMGYRRCDETGHVIPGFFSGVDPEQPHKEEHDVRAHLEGYITISAIKPSWNPPAMQAEELRQRLKALK